jgi:ribosome-binding factor A
VSRRRRRPPAGGRHRYSRSARVNELLRQVLADELERLVDPDEIGLITITGVETDPEMRHATVWVDHLDGGAAAALAALVPRLKRSVADQVRLKRTPDLSFAQDPAIDTGERVDEILRGLGDPGEGAP